jgi:hypothetical protein
VALTEPLEGKQYEERHRAERGQEARRHAPLVLPLGARRTARTG